jgi:hypothetical protein
MAISQKFVRTAALVASVLSLNFGCGPPKHAVQPSQASVSFYGSPQFMPIAGASVAYVVNATREVIHDGTIYYLYDHNIWFSSVNAEGPWEVAHAVPQEVIQIECVQLSPYNPLGTYQLCAVPFPQYDPETAQPTK